MINNKFNIKVSVIVPVYNASRYIDSCINSILNQSYENFELLVCNDGSTDDSLKRIKSFEKLDNRVRVFNQHNKGPSAARNVCMENAKGQYICFVDSDDIIASNFLKTLMIPILKNNADLGVTKFAFNKDEINIQSSNECFSTKEQISNFVVTQINEKNWKNEFTLFSGAGKIIKKEILDKHKLKFKIDISHAEDSLFSSELLKFVNKIVAVNTKQYVYQRHFDSLSNNLRNPLESAKIGVLVSNNLLGTFYAINNDIWYQVIKCAKIIIVDTIRTPNIKWKTIIEVLETYYSNRDIKKYINFGKCKNILDKVVKLSIKWSLYYEVALLIKIFNKLNLLQERSVKFL